MLNIKNSIDKKPLERNIVVTFQGAIYGFEVEVMQTCHYCGKDPYQYVNGGLGRNIPVAVVCCEHHIQETYHQLNMVVEVKPPALLEDLKPVPTVRRFGTLSLKRKSKDTPDQCGSDDNQ